MPRFHSLLTSSAAPTAPPPDPAAGPAVAVRDLTWSYKSGGAPTLRNLSFELQRGVRCLLVGANGAAHRISRRRERIVIHLEHVEGDLGMPITGGAPVRPSTTQVTTGGIVRMRVPRT